MKALELFEKEALPIFAGFRGEGEVLKELEAEGAAMGDCRDAVGELAESVVKGKGFLGGCLSGNGRKCEE